MPSFQKNLDFCTFNDHFVGHDLRTFSANYFESSNFFACRMYVGKNRLVAGWISLKNDNVTHEKLLEHKT